MTTDIFAKLLDGRQRGKELTPDEAASAAFYNYVVVYAAEEQLMLMQGSLTDEFWAYQGGMFIYELNSEKFIDADDYFDVIDLDDIQFYIRAKCCGYNWSYETDIPHSTFKIYDGEDLYCIGLVFERSYLQMTSTVEQ